MLRLQDSIGSFRNKHRALVYLFECSDCGTEIRATTSQLNRGHGGKCTSCAQRGRPYEAVYNELLNKGRKLVTITYEEFVDIVSSGICHYCTTPVVVNKHVKNKGVDISRAYRLDRMNNELGYISRTVCYVVGSVID